MRKPSLAWLCIAAVWFSSGMFAGSLASADKGASTALMTGFPPQHVVTKANWMAPPFNRWSFQHMEILTPTATISRGVGPHNEMPLASKMLRDRYQAVSLESGLNIDQYIAANHVDGLLVLRMEDRRVLHQPPRPGWHNRIF